jgi:hypothetical protein
MVMLWALAPPIIHELAHYVAALLCGSRIHFEFSLGRLGPVPVPRWTWRWPDVTPKRLRIICQAGFGLELLLVPFLPLQYGVVAVLHFLAYPHYAGDHSDFRGMV